MIRLIVYELKRKPSLAAVTFVISLRWGGGGGGCGRILLWLQKN